MQNLFNSPILGLCMFDLQSGKTADTSMKANIVILSFMLNLPSQRCMVSKCLLIYSKFILNVWNNYECL